MDFSSFIVCHLIGDFVFQNAWMASEKGKSWEVNFYHALLYTVPFWFLDLSNGFLLLILITHFLIDPLKARYRIIKHIWQDQLLHLFTLYMLKFLLAT